jgi:hypothetical protein
MPRAERSIREIVSELPRIHSIEDVASELASTADRFGVQITLALGVEFDDFAQTQRLTDDEIEKLRALLSKDKKLKVIFAE